VFLYSISSNQPSGQRSSQKREKCGLYLLRLMGGFRLPPHFKTPGRGGVRARPSRTGQGSTPVGHAATSRDGVMPSSAVSGALAPDARLFWRREVPKPPHSPISNLQSSFPNPQSALAEAASSRRRLLRRHESSKLCNLQSSIFPPLQKKNICAINGKEVKRSLPGSPTGYGHDYFI